MAESNPTYTDTTTAIHTQGLSPAKGRYVLMCTTARHIVSSGAKRVTLALYKGAHGEAIPRCVFDRTVQRCQHVIITAAQHAEWTKRKESISEEHGNPNTWSAGWDKCADEIGAMTTDFKTTPYPGWLGTDLS